MAESIRLTQDSHGAGCRCNISPNVPDVSRARTELAPVVELAVRRRWSDA